MAIYLGLGSFFQYDVDSKDERLDRTNLSSRPKILNACTMSEKVIY